MARALKARASLVRAFARSGSLVIVPCIAGASAHGLVIAISRILIPSRTSIINARRAFLRAARASSGLSLRWPSVFPVHRPGSVNPDAVANRELDLHFVVSYSSNSFFNECYFSTTMCRGCMFFSQNLYQHRERELIILLKIGCFVGMSYGNTHILKSYH